VGTCARSHPAAPGVPFGQLVGAAGTEHGGDGGQHVRLGRHVADRHAADAGREPSGDPVRHRHGEPGLAHARQSDQGHHVGDGEQFGHVVQRVVAPDEGQRRR